MPALLNQLADFAKSMDVIDTYIHVPLEHEKKRLASTRTPSSANDRTQTWISTIENAPRSIEAIQTLMDTKEVEMNKVSDISELQRLDREWSALEWLQGVLRLAMMEGQNKDW